MAAKIGKVPVGCRYLAVAAVALVCYVQTARYDFVYDDALQIVLNPRIRSFSNVGAAFTENFWGFISPHSISNYFRPLQTIIYMTVYALGGLWPAPYHWMNIVMHVFASLAVLWLGLLLLSDLKASISDGSHFRGSLPFQRGFGSRPRERAGTGVLEAVSPGVLSKGTLISATF